GAARDPRQSRDAVVGDSEGVDGERRDRCRGRADLLVRHHAPQKTRARCGVTDPLLQYRREFPILERTTYLVSNSLGAMPRTVAERLAQYVDDWAEHGVRAWTKGWWEMPVKVGDEIAPLIGAKPGEVV